MGKHNKNKLELTWIDKYDEHRPLEPRMLFDRCELGKDDYSLNIIELSAIEGEKETEEE